MARHAKIAEKVNQTGDVSDEWVRTNLDLFSFTVLEEHTRSGGIKHPRF